ncbi:DUF983 domain-containing protein [Devosia honganensis]|uniref:DUF983 domain-containing protein n=1 Tax=Devosia honganensis TaxID=1610527 RepID=A0ABV7WW22_9HYPH
MADENLDEKPTWPAIWRGIKCKCPRCGKAWLFHHYIEQVDACPVCGEPLAYYKVGLFLPLIVITIMVHIIAFTMLQMELSGNSNPLVYLYVLVPLSGVLSLALLPPAKGGLIGLMWAKGWSDEQDR